MTRLIVGPFNRVEGDLEIRLEVEAGRVREGFVTAPLFRDFEHLMTGRFAQDALVIAPRICGICSVSQSAAAASALAMAANVSMPPNGRAAFNLLQACENVADHLVHFALFFMPDFARACYADRPWHGRASERYKAQSGRLALEAADARKRLFGLMGILAGKWPHSLALQPGGTTKPVDQAERVRLIEILAEFQGFLEDRIFGASLEQVAALDTLDAGIGGDFKAFVDIANDLDLWRLGTGKSPLMSYGAFPDPESGALLLPSGLWRDAGLHPLDQGSIAEDVSHAWLQDAAPLHPSQGATEPDADRQNAYSWCKAPRLQGQPVEVGALARQIVAGQPLIRALHEKHGASVGLRVVARLVELARLTLQMTQWAKALSPRQPFCLPFPDMADGPGIGLVEAARGSLGHWLTIERGKLVRYQVISPTTWNFSPRDALGLPGPVEAALAGAPVLQGETSPVSVQHIVRSFDPCMACTVH